LPLTDKPSVVVQAHVNLLITNKIALGLADVFYGDQALIPRTPSVCVEAGPFDQEANRVGGRLATENTFRDYLLVYVGKVQDVQANYKKSLELAEAIRDLLNLDLQLGGLVVHGYVRSIEPGYVRKRDALLKVERILWQGMSQSRIV
jgi:hypothetical protein